MLRPGLLLSVLACCSAAAPGAELRVLSYNIHHARGADGEVDLPRIAEVINAARPDLVALNEVDRGVNRSGNVDQPAELGRLTGLQPVFEKNIDYGGGQYGNAVLSRWPVVRHENFALPSLYTGEQRGLLVVEVQVPDAEPLLFAATHLDSRASDAERMKSAETIEHLFASRFDGRRSIIAGDFNALPDSRVLDRFRQSWQVVATGPTFPADEPRKTIDYVGYRPAVAWQVVEAEVLDVPAASDHRPVLVVLDRAP